MSLSYPLQVKMPIFTLSPELHLEDSRGQNLLTFKQKIWTLREATMVFADKAKRQPLYTLQADRVIGFGAKHFIRRMDGTLIGVFENDGLRSLWRARYWVKDAQGNPIYHAAEENPWISLIDGLFSLLDEIPIVGLFTGLIGMAFSYFINPSYLLKDSYGNLRYRIRKQRSFFERRFLLEPIEAVPEEWEEFTLLALMRLVQLERRQG